MAFVRRSTVIVLTLLAVAQARAADAPPSRAVVETLALREGARPAVELGLSRAVEPVLHRLEAPPRVYVDLADAMLGARVARSLEGGGAVRKVRLGQFDARTVRVVIELATSSQVDVEPAPNAIRLVVGAPDGVAAAVPPKPAPRPAKVASAPAKVAPAPATVASAMRATSTAPPAKPAAEPIAARPDVAPIERDVPRLAVARTEGPLAAAPKLVVEPTALQDRVARRAAAEDWTGVIALYAADMARVRHDVDSATRAAVVDALRELGLDYSARKLLGPASPSEAPALRVARAEVALASGEHEDAAALVSGLDEAAIDPALAPKLRRVRVRLAIARGDLEGAAAGIGDRAIPELRGELARAAISAGRSATTRRACRRGVVAFRQALDADGGRTARAAAGAGLVRVALSCADRDATMTGLGVLAESPHPLLRRAAAVIATTQTDEEKAQPKLAARRGE